MAVYSFHRSTGHGFIQSDGKARNKALLPVGDGSASVLGICYGFFGANFDNPEAKILDFSRWYPRAVIIEEWRVGGIWKFNEVEFIFPDYLGRRNQTHVSVVNVIRNEFTRPSTDPPRGTRIITALAPTTIKSEWFENGVGGGVTYRSTANMFPYNGELSRDYGPLFATIDAALASITTYPAQRQVTPLGTEVGGGSVTPLVHTNLTIETGSGGGFGTLILGVSFPLWGLVPIVEITARKRKHRYRSTVPATDIRWRTRQRESFSAQPDMVSESPLPGGIDFAAPDPFPENMYEQMLEPISIGESKWSVFLRRSIVPPDTRPPGT